MNKKYYAALEAAGHLLKRDEDGEIDYFAMSYEFHNGPACELCHMSWCEHCEDEIHPCDVGVIESTCSVVGEQKLIGEDQ